MSYLEGEIIGFRQIHDNPPEVLVRTVTWVALLMERIDARPEDLVEFQSVPEIGSEWRTATDLDFQILKLQTNSIGEEK